MEQRRDQSSSDRTETVVQIVPECKPSKEDVHHRSKQNNVNAKLKRYKSCEDLSDRQFKQAHHQCWRVFEEFLNVRKRSTQLRAHSTCSTQSQGSSLSDTPAQTPTVEKELPQPRQAYRRLCSEPIGCTTTSGESDGACCHHRQIVRKQRSKDASSIEEEEDQEREEDCIVRSKPLNVVQVRPCSLGIQPARRSPRDQKTPSFETHKRMPSNSSGSDKAITPAPDPPLFSPIGAGGVPDFVETYPPAKLSRPRAVTTLRSPLAPPPGIMVTAGTPESQRHLCCGVSTSLPNELLEDFSVDPSSCSLNPRAALRSRIIAERLKQLGDKFQDAYGEECLETMMTTAVLGAESGYGLAQYIHVLTSLRDHLSWSKVSEIFSVGYSMFEKLSSQLGDPGVDARWDLFQKLWESTVSIVARWILDNGGWGAFLLATESGFSPRSDQDDAPGKMRPRLWSLSEAGSLVDEDGVTLLEASLELSGEEGEEEEEQEAEEEGESSSDFEGSLGLSGNIFSLDDDTFQVGSLPSSGGGPGHHQGSSDVMDDLCDSGITSSVEQLSLSPYENETNADHLISASASSPTLPSYHRCENRRNRDANSRNACPSQPSHGSPFGLSAFPGASPFDRNRSRSLPGNRRGQRPATLPRRTSERAMDGLLYTVNIGVNAVFFYAAVSHFLNK